MLNLINKRNINMVLGRPIAIFFVMFCILVVISIFFQNDIIPEVIGSFAVFLDRLVFSSAPVYDSYKGIPGRVQELR